MGVWRAVRRRVFLPMLVAEMLVATGQLQRTGDDLYRQVKRGFCVKPDDG